MVEIDQYAALQQPPERAFPKRLELVFCEGCCRSCAEFEAQISPAFVRMLVILAHVEWRLSLVMSQAVLQHYSRHMVNAALKDEQNKSGSGGWSPGHGTSSTSRFPERHLEPPAKEASLFYRLQYVFRALGVQDLIVR